MLAPVRQLPLAILGESLALVRGCGRGPTIGGAPLVDRWSLGGVGPGTVAYLARRLGELRPKNILEIGPGTSTIAMARALALTGNPARITALEHDGGWAGSLARRLGALGLGGRVRLIVGPLAPTAHGHPWYSGAEEARALGPFDFVFIDGPPARDGRARRYPALPEMWESLAPGAVFVLDDGRRRGERRSVALWRARYGDALSVEFVGVEKGLWVMRKRGS